jgi:acyl dehydratase
MTNLPHSPAAYADLPAALRSRLDPHLGVPYDVPAWNSWISPDAVWHFALGVGDDNPLWWAPSQSRRAFAPPTFLSSCANGFQLDEPSRPSIDDLLVDYSGVWITDAWHFEHPAWVGAAVRARSQLVSLEPRQSRSRGLALVQTERTEFYLDDADTPAAANTRTFLRFHRDSGASQREPTHAPPEAKYDAAEAATIARHYHEEPTRRRGPARLRPQDAPVGSPLPRLVKGPLTLTNIIGWLLGWGSALCPTNRIAEQLYERSPSSFWTDASTGIKDTLAGAHWNERLARETGLSVGYDFGAQRTAWIAHALTDWMGDDAFLADLTVSLLAPNLVGDTTWITGVVTDQRQDVVGTTCRCDLEARNQRGELTASATGLVRLSRPDNE